MTLRDTIAHILTGDGDLAPSLPDPAAVPGRVHELTNTNASAVVWSAAGTLPFLVDGVATASLTVPRGSSSRVQSDGTKWVLIRPPGVRRTFAATAGTNSSGQATFTFNPPFAAPPVVTAVAQPGALGTNGHFVEVLSVTASACTVQGWQGRGVLVGGQTTDPSGAGVTIHLHASEAG